MRPLLACVFGVALMLLSPVVNAQCPNGRCPTPGRPPGPEPAYQWHSFESDPDHLYLFHGSVQVGGYDLDGRYYRSFDARTGKWGECENDPPLPLPAKYARRAEKIEADPTPNYGLNTDELGRQGECWSINGKKVKGRDAQAVFGADRPPDDANLLRLTIAGGSAAERQAVLYDLSASPMLAPWKGRLSIQAYPADHWALRCGFKAAGNPTIYLQSSDGRVVHRQDDYADGSAGMALALRKVDPAYDARKDPDLRRPVNISPNFDLSKIPPPAWAVCGGVIVFLLLRKGS